MPHAQGTSASALAPTRPSPSGKGIPIANASGATSMTQQLWISAVDLTSLPWSHTETTTLTVVSGSISAQVHGGEVHCRMLVNGIVRDEQSATRQNADVTCRVKSA